MTETVYKLKLPIIEIVPFWLLVPLAAPEALTSSWVLFPYRENSKLCDSL